MTRGGSLQRKRQFSDLIQEQGTTIRQGKRALTLGQRAREGAAFVSKKLAARQLGNDGGAIEDHHVLFLRLWIEVVDEFCGNFLAGAALRRGAGWRYSRNERFR